MSDQDTTQAPDLSGIEFKPTLLAADYRTGSKWHIALSGEEATYHMGAAYWEVPVSDPGHRGEPYPYDHVKPHKRWQRPFHLSLHDEEIALAGRPMRPTLEDVISALCFDAECVRHGQTLHEFGKELGYEDLQDGLNAWEGCHRSYRIIKRLGLDREEVYEWARQQ